MNEAIKDALATRPDDRTSDQSAIAQLHEALVDLWDLSGKGEDYLGHYPPHERVFDKVRSVLGEG